VRVVIGPFREPHDVLARRASVLSFGLDHYRSINTALLLEMAVRVVPISSTLPYRKTIGEGCTRLNWRKTDIRLTVHARGTSVLGGK